MPLISLNDSGELNVFMVGKHMPPVQELKTFKPKKSGPVITNLVIVLMILIFDVDH